MHFLACSYLVGKVSDGEFISGKDLEQHIPAFDVEQFSKGFVLPFSKIIEVFGDEIPDLMSSSGLNESHHERNGVLNTNLLAVQRCFKHSVAK